MYSHSDTMEERWVIHCGIVRENSDKVRLNRIDSKKESDIVC